MEPTAFIVETPHTPQAGHAVVLPTEYDPLDKLLDDALTFFETAPMVECPATEPRRPLLTRRPPPLPTELVSFAQQPEACGVDDEERATERSSRPNSLMPLLVALPPQTPTTITVAMLPRKIVLHISRFVDPVTLVKVLPSVCRRFRWAAIARAKELRQLQIESEFRHNPERPSATGADVSALTLAAAPLVHQYLSTASELGTPARPSRRVNELTPSKNTPTVMPAARGDKPPPSTAPEVESWEESTSESAEVEGLTAHQTTAFSPVATFLMSFMVATLAILVQLGFTGAVITRESSTASVLLVPASRSLLASLLLGLLPPGIQPVVSSVAVGGLVMVWGVLGYPTVV